MPAFRPAALALAAALAVPASAQSTTTEVEFATRMKNDVNGYVVEARVPWSLAGGTPGAEIGFDVHVNDADAPGTTRVRKLVWSGSPGDEQHEDPRRFGTVALGASASGPAIARAERAPTLDGVAEGLWDGAAPFPLTHVRRGTGTPTPSDLSATAYALYDADALYLLVDVTDDRVVVDGDHYPHTDDGVELYLDGGNEKAERYDLNDVKLTFRPGLDLAGLVSLGAGGDYDGRAADAPWRRLAAGRIESLRKGPLRVRVEDAQGGPVEGAQVHVRMRRHAFAFGAALDAWRLADPGPDGDHYRQFVAERYNAVVLENDFKHTPWQIGAREDHNLYRRSYAAEAVRWLNESDIDVRAHYVFWNPLNRVTADSVAATLRDPEAVRQFWLDDVRRRVPEVQALGDIPEWDALNHITGWGPLATDATGLPFLVDLMRLSRELLPDETLYVNEGNVLTTRLRTDDYERDVRYLIDQGVAPDGVGFMGHFTDGSYTPPDTLYAIFDRFAHLVPRLKLTEFDINTADDSLQADYLRDVMTVAFSHPAVEGVVMWGFWAGDHWRPQAALYREDWTPKPSGTVWEQLVMDEWWTDETVQTGADGVARVRAFLGDHDVVVRDGAREVAQRVTLDREGEDLVVRLAASPETGGAE